MKETHIALTKTFPSTPSYGIVLDITSGPEVTNWISSAVLASSGKIDIVVSNVSSLSTTDDAASWTSAFETDLMGTQTLVSAALPHLEASKGNIIAIGSVSGRDVDFTAPGPYGAIKAALTHYMAQLATTLAGKGVRANTVSPGNIYVQDGVWGSIEKGDPELFEAQMKRNPMGRMGRAEEVADAVVWLASERASFVSGANLVVDGALCNGVQF